ncbi:DUF6456 domain-containing protein [Aestuariivirga sp.]|uniref:DUF6456 domain-containing protein n=1 Tax=Aestuariivirga sp. TaxID=2650926 RepID=UPI003017634B
MCEMSAKSATTPLFNEAESPLTWLRARRGKDGKPLISEAQYLAGERLRMDFERAMLARRTTLNWELAGTGSRSAGASAEMSDGAIAARQRYHAALDSVGPELGSILAQVCCLSAGIEQAERVLELPARSGRAVLGLALTALARHYGLGDAKRHGAITGWGVAGYRPALDTVEG